MIQHHKWSLSEIENMLPWERDIYVDKLVTWIKEENQRIQEQNRRQKYITEIWLKLHKKNKLNKVNS